MTLFHYDFAMHMLKSGADYSYYNYYHYYSVKKRLLENLYSVLSSESLECAHVLCQYVASKVLSECLKESRVSVSSFPYAGRLFHTDGPAQENALLPAVVSL